MLNLNYDKTYDTLYIGVGDNSNSYCSDVINNINIFRDIESEQITGFVIFSFIHKYHTNTLPCIPYEPSINFEKDIIPYI